MTGRVARAGAVGAALAALAGCGTGGGPAEGLPSVSSPATQAPAPSTAPTPPTASAADPDEIVCVPFTDTESLVRRTAEGIAQMPVLPAGVAMFLLGTRQLASTPGVQDAELAAAQVELVAAIDELDAQGRALLPPDGNPARDVVQLDPARLLAAVDTLEGLCARSI